MTSEQKAGFAGMACAVVAALLLALVMAGCATDTTRATTDAETARLWGYAGNTLAWVSGEMPDLYSGILIDQETGVEYLIVKWTGVYKGGLSVTPLLNADGTPYKVVE